MKQEQVNHPKHYNSHPAGIECIDIIRHYTCDIANALKYLWRAGLKPEMGKEDAEKEIEDLKKALWYINDIWEVIENNARVMVSRMHKTDHNAFKDYVKEITGHTIDEIVSAYDKNVGQAIEWLLHIGLIYTDGRILRSGLAPTCIIGAMECIQQRILDIETELTDKELQSAVDVLHGYAVEGEDYVAKPGGVRETEPDKYDPLNMMIIYGRAYCLTDEVRKKPNGALYSPCDNCDLMEVCYKNWHQPKEDECQHLCNLHSATDQQYYREVGYCKYSPRYGTIEVVDQQKEDELELKRLEEELDKED